MQKHIDLTICFKTVALDSVTLILCRKGLTSTHEMDTKTEQKYVDQCCVMWSLNPQHLADKKRNNHRLNHYHPSIQFNVESEAKHNQ